MEKTIFVCLIGLRLQLYYILVDQQEEVTSSKHSSHGSGCGYLAGRDFAHFCRWIEGQVSIECAGMLYLTIE